MVEFWKQNLGSRASLFTVINLLEDSEGSIWLSSLSASTNRNEHAAFIFRVHAVFRRPNGRKRLNNSLTSCQLINHVSRTFSLDFRPFFRGRQRSTNHRTTSDLLSVPKGTGEDKKREQPVRCCLFQKRQTATISPTWIYNIRHGQQAIILQLYFHGQLFHVNRTLSGTYFKNSPKTELFFREHSHG